MEPPNTPYGPYPCKAITKIFYNQDADGNTWTVFSGGMPRASYGDKFTVTVMKGEEKHSVFDLTSKISDFIMIEDSAGTPNTLVILAEEELAAVDLQTDVWPSTHVLPYLNPIHASSITCVHFASQVKSEIFAKIRSDLGPKISSKPWPVNGGGEAGGSAIEEEETPAEGSVSDEQLKDLLITGHEDGSVKFWGCGNTAMSLLATVKTAKLFISDDIDAPRDDDDEEEEDEWPPFKKVGQFDPYRYLFFLIFYFILFYFFF